MSSRIFGCSKYRRLASEKMDRPLSPRETHFMSRHAEVCQDCTELASQGAAALDFLRSVALDAQVTEHFDVRVRRRLQVINGREGIRYWTPAIIGGSVAVVALLMAVRSVSAPPSALRTTPIGSASRFNGAENNPKLILDWNNERLKQLNERKTAKSKLSAGQ